MPQLVFVIIASITICLLIIAIFIYRERRIRNRVFEEQREELEEQKKSILWGQEILISQIQPHFIYNVLNTIKYLCKKNPDEALIAIDRFSDFLRQSMEAFSKTEGIPFTEEFRTIQNYIYLEKRRFGQRVDVKYRIRCDKFTVPALSVQTLVENAIKHGITKKMGGGCVWIETDETDKEYTVTVRDNGVGFYVDQKPKDMSRKHVGLENTNMRLKLMYGGFLDVKSEKDVQTEAVIHIPKQ